MINSIAESGCHDWAAAGRTDGCGVGAEPSVFSPPGNDELLVPALLPPLVRTGCGVLLEELEVDAMGSSIEMGWITSDERVCVARKFKFKLEIVVAVVRFRATFQGYYEVIICRALDSAKRRVDPTRELAIPLHLRLRMVLASDTSSSKSLVTSGLLGGVPDTGNAKVDWKVLGRKVPEEKVEVSLSTSGKSPRKRSSTLQKALSDFQDRLEFIFFAHGYISIRIETLRVELIHSIISALAPPGSDNERDYYREMTSAQLDW
ncbi:uncharacterized protein BJ212DRAFT_1589043 [Suillus subaureus]|uniref:Uncharacterized protein n=1 Tax=Suillus subaureus TaxID=48587 RepID=A0A9P7E6F3_9AGAM|nr:uncharacterized protein BJ212DRAFT_1589043 [Suillus subaureus]KAG1812595.1 hypothetical protein BJ212DRAFT_1589043 [Suillus subaureus]